MHLDLLKRLDSWSFLIFAPLFSLPHSLKIYSLKPFVCLYHSFSFPLIPFLHLYPISFSIFFMFSFIAFIPFLFYLLQPIHFLCQLSEGVGLLLCSYVHYLPWQLSFDFPAFCYDAYATHVKMWGTATRHQLTHLHSNFRPITRNLLHSKFGLF